MAPAKELELIDAVIDEFDVSLTQSDNSNIFPDRRTLRSCALVFRAFLRPSQKRLFSTVSTRSLGWGTTPDERMRLFSKLISSKPHIANYVRTLILGYRCARSKSLDHILLSLPNLQRLSLHPQRVTRYKYNEVVVGLPVEHKDSFRTVFSLPSLRSLSLRDHQFSTPAELQSLLSNSVELEELALYGIKFGTLPVADRPPRLVLKSLKLGSMATNSIDALLHTVDMSGLRSLCCDRYHPALFQAAPAIQNLTLVTVRSYFEAAFSDLFPLGANSIIPSNVETLSLHLNNPDLTSLALFLHRVGGSPPRAITSLRRIAIIIHVRSHYGGYHEAFFNNADSVLLAAAPSVEEVHFTVHQHHPTSRDMEVLIRRCLPMLEAKGVLKFSLAPGDSSRIEL
ncbi:hypothetical protein C8R46DRAFT_1032086 [Mycena filopes]|nr:hypothetical protein C8R46DRAFT_1032086 [Mycena filopes]